MKFRRIMKVVIFGTVVTAMQHHVPNQMQRLQPGKYPGLEKIKDMEGTWDDLTAGLTERQMIDFRPLLKHPKTEALHCDITIVSTNMLLEDKQFKENGGFASYRTNPEVVFNKLKELDLKEAKKQLKIVEDTLTYLKRTQEYMKKVQTLKVNDHVRFIGKFSDKKGKVKAINSETNALTVVFEETPFLEMPHVTAGLEVNHKKIGKGVVTAVGEKIVVKFENRSLESVMTKAEAAIGLWDIHDTLVTADKLKFDFPSTFQSHSAWWKLWNENGPSLDVLTLAKDQFKSEIKS